MEVDDFSHFHLDENKIWAVIDCSFRNDDEVTFIDWKTGRGENKNLSLQLACYAMYGMIKWGIGPNKIKLVEHNLMLDHSQEFRITESDITNTTSYIKESVSDMESLLDDVENNVPKEERYFTKIEDDKIREQCNFRKVCDVDSSYRQLAFSGDLFEL